MKSRDACLLSIKKLLELENSHESYLHTLTFPDPEPSLPEASRRFNNFFHGTGAGARMGLRFVWCVQRGARTRRLHYHLVSGRRVDAASMWESLRKYGFGRYDVQPPQPAYKSAYIARYIGRAGHLEAGARSWGAVGFAKVRQADVESETNELTIVAPVPPFVLSAWFRIRIGETNSASCRNFIIKRWGGTIQTDHKTMRSDQLNETQKIELLRECCQGGYPVTVGEYRGFTIVTREKRDKLSGVTYPTHTVEHVILAGVETLKVSEFLQGAADAQSVKAAAEIGEIVVLRVASWSKNSFGLSIRGHIKPLTSLPLTPVPPAGKK